MPLFPPSLHFSPPRSPPLPGSHCQEAAQQQQQQPGAKEAVLSPGRVWDWLWPVKRACDAAEGTVPAGRQRSSRLQPLSPIDCERELSLQGGSAAADCSPHHRRE
ncbi:unnamed protein product [Closterium sp. NIES-54]